MTVTHLGGMTLSQAKDILAGIGYQENWTTAEIRAACSGLSDAAIGRVIRALGITGIAALSEAQALEAEKMRRASRSPKPTGTPGERMAAFHIHRAPLNTLAYELGNGMDWLISAIEHLKASAGDENAGAVTVSAAALHIVLSRLDELEQGCEAWEPEPTA